MNVMVQAYKYKKNCKCENKVVDYGLETWRSAELLYESMVDYVDLIW